VGIVRKGRDAIAAGVFLTRGQTLIYKYAASDPEALDVRPNDWLVYNSMRLAAEEAYSQLDFGVSRLEDEGLRHFKRRWGAAEIPVHFEYLVGHAPPSGLHGLPLRMASLVIRHGPPTCCRAIGALFYKYSP
jgi:CelD/BcsL family acetyltransferase involved in cellulose biosynthesis